MNYDKVSSLQTFAINDYVGRDLSNLLSSPKLERLSLFGGKTTSLKGINDFPILKYLALFRMRSLQDIADLRETAKSLKILRINNCPKITDFSVLEELEQLEFLELTGNNSLWNINFLRKIQNLKSFWFSINIEDGDLSPCLSLSFAKCTRNRKHYNLTDCDLPKTGRWIDDCQIDA